MLRHMSSKLLAEWMAFFQLEPFGYKSSLHGSAMVSAIIANVNRKKGAKAFQPDDFLPKEVKENKGSFVQALKRHLGLKSK